MSLGDSLGPAQSLDNDENDNKWKICDLGLSEEERNLPLKRLICANDPWLVFSREIGLKISRAGPSSPKKSVVKGSCRGELGADHVVDGCAECSHRKQGECQGGQQPIHSRPAQVQSTTL